MINILSKEIYNRISAGEVVERPASVVKELFENAVDAGATEISVYIENGGIDKILVMDNGCGIPKDDLPKAYFPHATSKISSTEDLDRIETLGFRGEALASISSVAKCNIATKTEEADIGYRLSCEGGVLGEITETACKEGTAVYVNDLFYNTPARLKFLKQPKGEEREVTSLMEKLMLSNPYVLVRYYVDEKLILNSYGEGFKDAVFSVYGREAVNNSYEIKTNKNGLLIEGFLGSTNYTKANRTYQTIVVNGRWVTDSTISSAIANAYSGYLMKRQYPFYVLSITMPGELVDVNVHPRKAEVRFQNNQVIYSSIYSVVSKVLDGTQQALDIVVSAPKTPIIVDDTPISEAEIHSKPVDAFDLVGVREDRLSPDERFKWGFDGIKNETKPEEKKEPEKIYPKYVVPKPLFSSTKVAERPQPVIKDFSEIDKEKGQVDDIFKENKEYIAKLEKEKKEAEQEKLDVDSPIKVIGQVLNTFLILECGADLMIVDQHAAHERIIFDEFCARLKTNTVVKQTLLVPYAFRVNPTESDALFDKMQYFRELGFDLEEADDDMFKIYSVPMDFVNIDLDSFIRDILFDKKFKEDKIPGILREKLIQKACKSAIKSGDKLSQTEINRLLVMLKKNWGLKCPHGRPVCIKITRTEIDKWFKRIV